MYFPALFVLSALCATLVLAEPHIVRLTAEQIKRSAASFTTTLRDGRPIFKNLNQQDIMFLDETRLNAEGFVPLTNFLEFQFFGEVLLGTPKQPIRVCFDTGSSDFWVPALECTNCASMERFQSGNSSSFHPVGSMETTAANFTVAYGSGSASGFLATESVQLGPFHAEGATVGLVLKEGKGLAHMKAAGILGMAFDGLSSFSHPPIFELLVRQNPSLPGKFTFYLSKVPNSPGSQLVLGGVDASRHDDDTQWLSNPVVPQLNTLNYWLVELSSFIIGGDVNVCGSGCVTLVDTGTSLLGVPVDVYSAVIAQISRSTTADGCLCALTIYGYQCFLCSAASFPTLRIGLSGTNYFELSGEDYTLCAGGDTCIPLIQATPAAGFWILGDVFLKKYAALFAMGTESSSASVSFACEGADKSCGPESKSFLADGSLPAVAMPDAHTVTVLFVSGLSMVGSAFIVGCFWHYPTLRQKRVLAMVFWLSVCNLVYNLTLWVAGIARFPTSRPWCDFQAGVLQFSGLASVLFSGVISLELLRAVRGLQSETADHSRLYHAAIWTACAVLTALAALNNTIGQVPDLDGPDRYCWTDRTSGAARLLLFYLPVVAMMVLSVYAVHVAVRRLRETNLLETASGRRSAKLLISYVLVFLVSYLLPVVLGILSLIDGVRWPESIAFLNEVCFYSQGILNCFVWAFSPSFHEAYQTRFALEEHEVQCLLTDADRQKADNKL